MVTPGLAEDDLSSWNWSQFYAGAGVSANQSWAKSGGGSYTSVNDVREGAPRYGNVAPFLMELAHLTRNIFTQERPRSIAKLPV